MPFGERCYDRGRPSSRLDPGYYLPEEAQYRLQQLRDHMRFLARLAQPRTLDEEREAAPKVRAGELAVCMELLAEQMDMVLREVSWPAQRQSPYQAQGYGADSGAP